MKRSIPVRKKLIIAGLVNIVRSIDVKDESLKKYIILLICLIPLTLSVTNNQQPKHNLLQPFYCVLEGKTYYIVYDGENVNTSGHFKNGLKYGIDTDEPRRILPVEYEKIYNPNLTLLNCFEIKRDGKVGLFNYKTGKVLEPKFDYIMPSGKEPGFEAYGYLDGQYYRIEAKTLESVLIKGFNSLDLMSSVSFNIHQSGRNAFYYTYDEAENGISPLRQAVVIPSWIEYLELLPNPYYWDVFAKDDSKEFSNSQQATVTTRVKKTLSEKLWSFIVDVYESGVDVRDYTLEAERLVVLNTSLNTMQTSTLVTNHRYAPCKEGEYRAISNFLIELKDTRLETYSNPQLYDFESRFQYLQISDNGEINRLTSNRYFDATKFVKLEERHFRGCFVNRMKKSDEDGYYNLWKFDHLAIDDLDIMRNEIFADYGYRFKSEKWQKYFAKKSWYKPRFDDVNDQLSEIDKANIQFILNMKKKMTGREKEFTKPRKDRYVAAG